MGDTRCANPEYQFDVDVLMLEYLLHHAIRAHLVAAQHQPNDIMGELIEDECGGSHEVEDEEGKDKAWAATRTRTAFTQFQQKFQGLHPDYQPEPGRAFDGMLFESLLLVEAAKLSDVGASVIAPQFDDTDELRQCIARRTKITDLVAVTAEARPDVQIPSKASTSPQKKSQKRHPTFLLLHRFMILNARLLEQLPGKTITEEWMQIAGSLMQLAALETIDGLNDSATNSSNSVEQVCPTIIDCFAYHHVPVLKQLKEPGGVDISEDFGLDCWLMEEEQAISDMFRSCEDTWGIIRQRYLDELPTDPVGNLAHRQEEYHAMMDKVMKSVYDCLADIFRINSLPEISGKPALVQIEEGGLTGMSGEDFQMFAERVGLAKIYEP
ncbi:uncharacterized protein AB675_8457 [Cyphellophora attinorum]|uniref:Uncharacterized protein n=1 Tax=Cyphellophora attinorum TaxID=1664694 RepID=A0A0N1H9T8_9EURO|nr:uncharacterized protein AB675_8457 [Phialophora attinorum]KPI44506.1 hypothetical protein AB675_8457 [Phialophora attinorum]